ncbi:unnamed protein product [Clonostachys solani]|uniref:Uncharacterized protein n=1 Tax=Clonostachys solani TaxID=160281 RepID=A0A9N9ZLP9_9HYPO|nr:unnamed protein product [Clonostachys solani]
MSRKYVSILSAIILACMRQLVEINHVLDFGMLVGRPRTTSTALAIRACATVVTSWSFAICVHVNIFHYGERVKCLLAKTSSVEASSEGQLLPSEEEKETSGLVKV